MLFIVCEINARTVDHTTTLTNEADSLERKALVPHGDLRYDYFDMKGEDGKHSVETTHKLVGKGVKGLNEFYPL
ncbi:MAG: hypothetical protein IKD21_00130 [Clostridia bacterium]|nr:hypothetical protein [Clostridia bacterium]